jgi:hypothetical protein
MWVLPFVQPLAWKPSTHFFPEWFAAVLGLGVCALLAGRRFTALPLESVALAALAAMLALQPLALTLPYVQPSVAHASLALWTAALMAAGHTLRATLGAAHCATTLAAWTATGASLAGLIGLLQHFGLAEALAPLVPPPDPGGTASGAIRHQSWFADHLVIGLAALAWLAARQTLPAVAALALALPMAAGVAVSGSRAPLLMLALGLGLGLAARWRLPAPWSRRLPLWQGLWLLLTLGLAWLLPRLAGGSAGTLTRLDTAYGDGAGLGSRMELWARAWRPGWATARTATPGRPSGWLSAPGSWTTPSTPTACRCNCWPRPGWPAGRRWRCWCCCSGAVRAPPPARPRAGCSWACWRRLRCARCWICPRCSPSSSGRRRC